MKKWVWNGLVALLLAYPALAMTAETIHPTLDGSAWILTGLPTDPLLENTTATLKFDSGRVAGTDGCNRFTGSYEYAEGDLRIGKLASTMMACPEEVMHQARSYLEALALARSAAVEEDFLVLRDTDGQELARFSPQPSTLANSRWGVTGYNNGKQAVVSTAQGTSLSLEFDAAGGVSGSAGCNQFRASYTVDGESISIGQAAATRKLCAEPVMTQEAAYLQALENSARLDMEGERLELRDEDGALQVSATRITSSEDDSP